MPFTSSQPRRALLGLLLIAMILIAVFVLYRVRTGKPDPNRYGTMQGWQSISGRWNEHNGIFTNANYGRGDMLVAQHSEGANYTISADIRFDLLFPETHYGDAGLVIRTSNPEPGVDSYQGYYAGIRPDAQTLVLGRASYEWHELKAVPLAMPASVGVWNHLSLMANGCHFTVLVTPLGGGNSTRLDYDDPQCLTSGVAGLRSFYAQASWRNVKITGN